MIEIRPIGDLAVLDMKVTIGISLLAAILAVLLCLHYGSLPDYKFFVFTAFLALYFLWLRTVRFSLENETLFYRALFRKEHTPLEKVEFIDFVHATRGQDRIVFYGKQKETSLIDFDVEVTSFPLLEISPDIKLKIAQLIRECIRIKPSIVLRENIQKLLN